uniref:F-box and WD repeat domain containing 9 n=1 Tax=Tetraodon nigroviridis TaxID=99883 RepID=H3C686_TETNG
GLLALPWEMVTHIASHLPAQCVISVLPKVCHVLGNVGKDSTAWQLRARRLVGARAGFPVGPREDVDWPSACLEMEQLVSSWTGQADFVASISLPLKHFAQIDTILLLGGEATVCVTGSRDRNVHLWDLQSDAGRLRHTFAERGTFSTHQGWVWCLGAQGNSLASGAFDSTIRLWDLQACGTEMGLIRTGAPVHCLSYQPDVLLAGTIDRKVNMYDPRDRGFVSGFHLGHLCVFKAAEPLVKSLRPHSKAVICLAADDKYILSGSTDCTVAMYDRRAGKALKRLRLNSYLMAMSYSGCEMWAGDNKGNLHSFSVAGTLKALSQFDVGHTALITGIHSSAGSLYTCSSDSTVKVHIPCAPPRTLCTLQHRGGVNALNVKAGVLAVAFGEFYAEIWRPRK